MRHMAVMAFSFLEDGAGTDAEAELFAIAENDADELQASALNTLRQVCPNSSKLRQVEQRLTHSDKFWVRGNAIACLDAFHDRESIDALLSARFDEGGPDFDNAGAAAKILQRVPLEPDHVLGPLMATLQNLLAREDQLYEVRMGRGDMQNLPDQLKFAAASDDSHSRQVVIVCCADPGSLLNVARILARLGPVASPTIPLIRTCMSRPYVSGNSDLEEWQEILRAIGDTSG